MHALTRSINSTRDRLALLTGFLESPRDVAYLVPSSRALAARVARAAEPGRARVVVELGPGTGGTTRSLLARMGPRARLVAVERHPRFVTHLARSLEDPRVLVHGGCATDVAAALAAHGLGAADAVVSGIPFSHLPPATGRAILRAVHASLAPGGRFVAYQLRGHVSSLARPIFGRGESASLELFNLPPMRVYRWLKT